LEGKHISQRREKTQRNIENLIQTILNRPYEDRGEVSKILDIYFSGMKHLDSKTEKEPSEAAPSDPAKAGH
jgi:hypothetical protein